MWDAIHKCVEATLGISVYSYLYLNLPKTICLSYCLLCVLVNKIEEQEDGTGSASGHPLYCLSHTPVLNLCLILLLLYCRHFGNLQRWLQCILVKFTPTLSFTSPTPILNMVPTGLIFLISDTHTHTHFPYIFLFYLPVLCFLFFFKTLLFKIAI
jgi:hypothetical protein